MSLHAYLPQDRLRAVARYAPLPDRARGSALFADISGFTALTESLTRELGARRGVEELARRVNAAYDALVADIERYGGSVISFAGDAVTCWFDDAASAEFPAPRRAAACAVALQRTTAGLPCLGVKVAVATGDARRFLVGDPALHYVDALAGATVARMARGERLAATGEILVDAATAEALGASLAVREWRTDGETGERFAAAGALALDADPACPFAACPRLSNSTIHPYLHPAVYEREVGGLGSFLTELRPCVSLFIRFLGIDYEADDAKGRLDAFVRQAQAAADRHGGAVLQLVIGDKGSYLCVGFGVLGTHEDDAERALRAAREIAGLCELCLQTGLAAGVLRVGTYGAASRCVFGALGDDANLAARLMALAAPGEILVSASVHAATEERYAFEPRAAIPVKGRPEPVPVFAVAGEREVHALRLQEPTYGLPMVGRKAELARIEEALDLALEGRSQVVGVTGEAGLGKSRLVAEAIRIARRKGFTGYGGACRSDGTNAPYLPWKTVWSAFFDVDPGASPARRQRLLEREVEDRAPDRVGAAPLLGPLLDFTLPDTDFTRTLEPVVRRSALHALLEDCLRSGACEEPILIVLEDYHWIDALSHDLLEELAFALADARIVFLLALRPLPPASPLAGRLRALPRFTRIELRELVADEAAQAVQAKLAQLFPARMGDPVPPELVEVLMARSQGNPFFLEELLNYLRDRGLDPRDPAALARIELPQNLHTLVLSRLDQLLERQRTILRVASVVGRVFPVAWLTGFYPGLGGASAVVPDLDEMRTLEITALDDTEPELAYLFKHVLLHEVTYESLPFDMRSRLHGQLADYLERTFPDAPPLDALAFHYGRSGNEEKQREYLRRAAGAARRSYATGAALAYLDELLPLLSDPAERAAALLEKGEILFETSRLDEALAVISDARAAAETAGDARGKASAIFQTARVHSRKSDYDASYAALVRAEAAFTALGDRVQLGRVLAEFGNVRHRRAEYDEAYAVLDRAIDLLRETGDKVGLGLALSNLGNVLTWQGRNEEARRMYEESVVLRQAAGDRLGVATSTNNLAIVLLLSGDIASCEALYRANIVTAREIGDKYGLTLAYGNLGEVLMMVDRFDEARRMLEESLAIEATHVGGNATAYFSTDLAILELYLGNADEARRRIDPSLAVAERSGEPSLIDYVHMAEGYVFLASGPGRPGEPAAARARLVPCLLGFFERKEWVQGLATLAGFAGVRLAEGDAAGAARTLGAVDAISRAQGQAVEPVLQRLHRRLLDETRAALGDAAFDAAFAEGGRLSLEEAVAREVPNAP